jgi:hypothetical protein
VPQSPANQLVGWTQPPGGARRASRWAGAVELFSHACTLLLVLLFLTVGLQVVRGVASRPGSREQEHRAPSTGMRRREELLGAARSSSASSKHNHCEALQAASSLQAEPATGYWAGASAQQQPPATATATHPHLASHLITSARSQQQQPPDTRSTSY